MKRWILGWVLSIIGFSIVLVPTCTNFSTVAEKTRDAAKYVVNKGKEAGLLDPINADTSNTQPVTYNPAILERKQSEVVIGSLNIKSFGPTKIADKKVMGTLAEVARQFDVLAVQELRSKHDQTIMSQYVAMINQNGAKYNYVVSALLGEGRYFEQYAFIYDTKRIELVNNGLVIPDPNNLMQREPMVSHFRTRTADRSLSFSFALANVHIKPAVAHAELQVLHQMYVWLQSYVANQWGEDDVILLGDFNAPPHGYGGLWQIETLGAALDGSVFTNTARSKSLDNILFDSAYTREFKGKSGVIDYEKWFNLTREEAEDVSDHLPVWAVFSAVEGGVNIEQFAKQPSSVK